MLRAIELREMTLEAATNVSSPAAKSGRMGGWLLSVLSVGTVLVTTGFLSTGTAQADIFALGQFSNTIERFDAETGTQTTFADLGVFEGGFVAPSSFAYNGTTKQFVVGGFQSGKIYTVDARTGNVLASYDGGGTLTSPSGMAYDSAGNLYVSDFGTNSISVFDSGFNVVDTIQMPNFGSEAQPFVPIPSGLGFSSTNQLLINTFNFAGVVSYDVSNGTFGSFNGTTAASLGQMAIGADGRVYSGVPTGGNNAFIYDAAGNSVGTIELTADLLPPPGQSFTSDDFTNPGGVAIDPNGDIIVAALGRTNPFSPDDNFQQNGGLFRFSADGTYQETYAVQTTPFAAVLFVPVSAIPEPGAFSVLVVAAGGLLCLRRRR
jgi:DNA-binding beta-propeller fold protein YncE